MNEIEIVNSLALKFMKRNPNARILNNLAKEKRLAAAVNYFNQLFNTFNSANTLTKILSLETVTDYATRVKLREEYIEANPDKEHWDNPEYIQYNGDVILGPFRYLLIGTKGNVQFLNSKGYPVKNSCLEKEDYTRILFHDNEWNEHKYFIHRLMSSTFRSIPERLKNENMFILETNHKDGKKNNSIFENIEWMTKEENVNHAIETGKKKIGIAVEGAVIYLGIVKVNNKYKGMKVVVCGTNQMEELHFNKDSIYLSTKNEENYFGGCKWSTITKEEADKIGYENDSDLVNRIAFDKAYMNMRTKPIVATVINGPYEGQQFSFFGTVELKDHGFDQGHVSRVCAGKLKTHKNCKWRQTTFEDADKYVRGMEKKILDTL